MPRYYDSDDDPGNGDSSDEEDDSSKESEDGEVRCHKSRHSKQATAKLQARPRGVSSKQPMRKFPRMLQTPQRRFQHSEASTFLRAAGNQLAGVYVLRNTETNVCYVGKSGNIEARLLQHREDSGNAALHRERTMTGGSVDDLESWERNEVLTRMYRGGMESVRGWRYTTKGQLSMEDRISARNDIMEKFDLCRRCGHNNHFADKCFARSPASWCKDIPMQ
jgi:hypothetical protein